MRDKQWLISYGQWPAIIGDESHRLRNRKTGAFKMLKAMRYDVFVPASGTQLRNGPQDLWSLLHLCNKRLFSSFWKFVHTYCHVEDGEYGKEIGGVRNERSFQELLRKRCVFISEGEVAHALPSRNRQRLYVEMDTDQAKMYHTIENNLIAEMESGHIVMSRNPMVQTLRLRQCLTCPQMLDPDAGIGAGIKAVAEHIEDDQHAIIYTPFAKALPIWQEYLKSLKYRNVYMISGGMSDAEHDRIVQEVQKTRGILLSTIGAAESWEVLTCTQAYFIQYEWTPDINRQAEDRIRRGASLYSYANFYYITHEGTYDEDVLAAVNDKNMNCLRAQYDPEDLKRLISSKLDTGTS